MRVRALVAGWTTRLMKSRPVRPVRRRLKHLWKRYLRWPVPLWRLRGYVQLPLADHRFKFLIDNANLWWAWRIWKGRWETSVHDFFQGVLQPGDVFFDVGAYMGEYTLQAARLVQPTGAVYAFEPDPVARRLLERNLAANNVSNVTVLPFALADQEGTAWLDSPTWLELGTSDSTVTSRRGMVEIQTVTMRGFCERNHIHPSVIKIDTPGCEPQVVAGGIDVVKNARVSVVELNERKLRQLGQDPSMFLQSLFELGKRIIVLHQRSPEGPPPGVELTRGATATYMNLALIVASPDGSAAEEKEFQPVTSAPAPLRIAFHVPHAGYLEPGYSGDHSLPRTLLAGLRRRGHDVKVVSRLDPCDFGRGRLPARRFVADALAVRKEMQAFSPHAWFVYAPSEGCPDLLGWWQQPRRYLLFAANAPNEWPWHWRDLLLTFVHRRSLARADRITAIRHTSAERLQSFGVTARRLSLSPPAAETWEWIPTREEARRHLGLPENAPIILCVARFSVSKSGRPKKTEMLLDLIATIASLPPDVVLVLVGDGKGRERLEAAAAELKAAGRVRFAGFVEHGDLRWYYAACDVYAFPHPKDDSWVTVLEAQYCGRPVVTMRTRSAEITVEDGRTGLLAKDLDDFRAHLAALAGDRARCEVMGQAAREYIERHHSIETRVRQIEELLVG